MDITKSSDSEQKVKDPFDEYDRASDPTWRERSYAWETAIGLQAVDGLKTSSYLQTTAARNIDGEITIDEAQALIESYYQTDRKKDAARTEEADRVSARIARLISDKGFTFSAGQYLSIHKQLFGGIYSHAGTIRDYNITKKEWVLDQDTVIYGSATELRSTLEYDLSQERNFDYSGLSMNEVIRHLARFVSRLWQIHVFGEGNTRTTAVFFIKYLQSLGFNVTNDIFANNAWYFRNALVRANYNNLRKGVHETTEYLELFLRNLLLNEKHPLKNRTMHISGELKQHIDGQKQNIEEQKQYIEDLKQYIDRISAAGFTKKTTANAVKLLRAFGFERFFSRSDVMELLGITASPATTLMKKLSELGITEAVSGMGKGKYRFNPAFFQ